jgi:hypothetical protein
MFASVLLLIGTSEPLWVALDSQMGEDNEYETVSFTLTVWTSDLVVHVTRGAGSAWPVTRVQPRGSLQGLALLRVPMAGSTFSQPGNAVLEIELEYPGFTVRTLDKRGTLAGLLPQFLADLRPINAVRAR